MNKKYEYIIIGAGPSGLSLAWILSKFSKNILIIDGNSQIGGCHRINRNNNGLFQTHGPKIIGHYLNYESLLTELGLSFKQLYQDFSFDITSIGDRKLSDYSFNEIIGFITAFFNLFIDNDYGSNISMSEFMDFWKFNNGTKHYIDQLCILTDGRGADFYSLREFIQLANKQALYKVYLPKYPNDEILFPTWEKQLLLKNVTIIKNTFVSKISTDSIIANNKIIYGDNIILAIPPKPLAKLLTASGFTNIFNNDINKWEINYSYNNYLPITLHWNTNININKTIIFPTGIWNIAGIVISNVTKFSDPRSKTVIECTITKSDVLSTRINKTANMCSIEELVTEIVYQLNLSNPTDYAHNLVRDNNQWYDNDTAFFASVINHKPAEFLKQDSSIIKNLFNVGCHNGYHMNGYPFTSLEGAIQNSIALAHKLKPETKNDYYIIKPYELFDIFKLIIFVFVLIGIAIFRHNN